MDALELLRQEAEITERVTSQVLTGITSDQAAWRPEGSAANTIAATIFHAYSSEDRLVQRCSGKQPLFERWWERLGVDPDSVWSSDGADIDQLRAYAAEVTAASKQFLQTVDPNSLTGEVDTPLGRRPLIVALSLLLVIHKSLHMGDVAALLGCQGAKGLPF